MAVAKSARDGLDLLLSKLQSTWGSAGLANGGRWQRGYLVVQILGSPLGDELLLDLPKTRSAGAAALRVAERTWQTSCSASVRSERVREWKGRERAARHEGPADRSIRGG